MRIDKYLKVSRLIKRREVAKEMLDRGLVTLNGKVAKPASEVKEGDLISITSPTGKKAEVKVLAVKNVASSSETSSLYQVLQDK